MGELAEHIFVTGAPGLDSIYQLEVLDAEQLFAKYGLSHRQPLLLILFHPVVQQANEAGKQITAILDAAVKSGMQILVMMPNADAGGRDIENVVRSYGCQQQIKTASHVPRSEFLSLMKHAEVMAGNSSSGIIEAASLDTPVVNIGDRQRSRERSLNVLDVVPDKQQILLTLKRARKMKGQHWCNVYGDGDAARRIVDRLTTVSLSPDALEKLNAY